MSLERGITQSVKNLPIFLRIGHCLLGAAVVSLCSYLYYPYFCTAVITTIILQATLSGVRSVTRHLYYSPSIGPSVRHCPCCSQSPSCHFMSFVYSSLDVSVSSLPSACFCNSSPEDCLRTLRLLLPEAQRSGGMWEWHPSTAAFSHRWKGQEHSPPWEAGWNPFCGTLPELLLDFFSSSKLCLPFFLIRFSQEHFPSNSLAQDSLPQDWLLGILAWDVTYSPFKSILFDYKNIYLTEFWIHNQFRIFAFIALLSSLQALSRVVLVVMMFSQCCEGLCPSGSSCQNLSGWHIILLPNYLFPCLCSLLWLKLSTV